MTKTTNRVLVLGINGRIGIESAKAFQAAGWTVKGLGRTNRAKLPGVTFIKGDAANPADIRAAATDVDIVVNALNSPYDKWDKGRAEALHRAVRDGLRGLDLTMIFPANIYNYPAGTHVLTPETPFAPEKDKGAIRVRIEEMFEAAARAGDFRVILVRLADFFAPGATGSNFDLAMMARIKSGVLQYPGKLEIGHSWAYLPDVGRAFAKLAVIRESFGSFERFHFEGHFATGHEMVDAIQAALPEPAKVRQVPWFLLKAIGLVVPVVREVVKMNYLWDAPHRLVDPRLREILGPDFDTPFAVAVAKTTRSYLPAAKSDVTAKALA